MKKIIIGMIIFISCALSMYAYNIGGAYARLVKCVIGTIWLSVWIYRYL